MSALGFFQTGNDSPVRARHAEATPARTQKAESHAAPASTARPAGKSGVAIKMKEKGDSLDKEFERF
jgi:hypothetical protein